MAENSIDTVGSPMWWMQRLTRRQQQELNGTTIRTTRGQPPREKVGLYTLDAWRDGDPPLPVGSYEWLPAYQHFHKSTRTNYAELVVESARERMTPIGFRTGANDDRNGDAQAARLWDYNKLAVGSADLLADMLGVRMGYAMVTPPSAGSKFARITVEDPFQVITAHDPVDDSLIRAAMKRYVDPDTDEDITWVWIRGKNGGRAQGFRAVRAGNGLSDAPPTRGTEKSWVWDDPIDVPTERVPFVRFLNRKGRGEFEGHLDLLSRLNQTTLQRMLIAELQAFRQRAVEGLPEVYPSDWPVPEMRGKMIDYEGVFTPGPGALWQVPPGVKFWESQPIDLRPLLDAEDRDIRRLASLTRMPIAYFNPDAANGSAEGASFQREGLVFRVEDRKTIASASFAETLSLAFEMMGDADRADVSQIETLWAPIERLSLTEVWNAAVQAKTSGQPRDTIRREVLGWTPEQIALAQQDDEDEFLLQQQVALREAQLAARVNPPTPPGATVPPQNNVQPPRSQPTPAG